MLLLLTRVIGRSISHLYLWFTVHLCLAMQFISEFSLSQLEVEWTDLTSQSHNFVFHYQFAVRDFQKRTSHTAREPISVSRVTIRDQSTSKNADLRTISVSKFPICDTD